MHVDPTYPLYPIATIVCSALLLLLLSTSFARQSWNVGVTFLSFWLFWENLTWGIDAVIWKDNADIKNYVYCDIVSRVQMAAVIVKPACTLIISRRLYKIASLRSVEAPSQRERRLDLLLEWTLGFILPIIVAGPLYYIVEKARFEVLEGFGCANAPKISVLELLFIASWQIAFSSISVIFYCPRVIWVFYRHRRDTMRFLRSNNTVSRDGYFRILAIGSLDAILTFPFSIALLILAVNQYQQQNHAHLPFYQGWAAVHANWTPISIPYSNLLQSGAWSVAHQYFEQWTSPLLGYAIFALFGCTAQARETYWKGICTIGNYFGWTPSVRSRPQLDEMAFDGKAWDGKLDIEQGSRPSFVSPHTPDYNVLGKAASLSDTSSESNKKDPELGLSIVVRERQESHSLSSARSNSDGFDSIVGCDTFSSADSNASGIQSNNMVNHSSKTQ